MLAGTTFQEVLVLLEVTRNTCSSSEGRMELAVFFSRYLIKVSRNEIKTKYAGNFLIYAE